MTAQQRAEALTEFRIKFGILRRKYPRYQYPDIPDNVDLGAIHVQYNRYVRQIIIDQGTDSSVGQFRIYFIIFLVGIELFCVKVLGLSDMSGYTQSQLEAMDSYDRLLVELGEKNYGAIGAGWPVEIRLILLALFNAVVFFAVRKLAGSMGPDVAGLIQRTITGFIRGPAQTTQTTPTAESITSDQPTTTTLPSLGGFDLGGIISGLTGMFGRNTGTTATATPAPRASRRPRYTE